MNTPTQWYRVTKYSSVADVGITGNVLTVVRRTAKMLVDQKGRRYAIKTSWEEWFPTREEAIAAATRNEAAAKRDKAKAKAAAAAEELLQLAYQYLNDMKYPPAADSRDRRIEWIERVLAKVEGAA